MTRLAKAIGWLILLGTAQLTLAQVQVGENTKLDADALFTAGYSGDYGNQIQSSHSVNFGASGALTGSYYNPNFLNFNITPYYNQSKADSDYQSLTNASGVAASANFFTGSHFPGNVSYRYDYNSTGTLGLASTPNFTTQGTGQGFSVGWSALLPNLPSLSVGYQQGSGSGTLYGTNQETSSHQRLFNLHSSYTWEGFLLNGYYDRNSLHSLFPEFLGNGVDNINNSSGQDFGVNTSRRIPWENGQGYASFSHSTYKTNYLLGTSEDTNSNYTTDTETAGASFHPTNKFGWYLNQIYTNNLSGYINQSLINNGISQAPIVNLGTGSYSSTMGGGVNYQFTQHLNSNVSATHFSQQYLGHTYTGTFLSGNVNYSKKIFDMFSFSAGVVDSYTGTGTNNVGFVGNMNYFRRFGSWETSGTVSYAQNVQSVLVTETTSSYSYNANLHRRFSSRVQWTAAFNGNHSGLSTQGNQSFMSNAFSTSLSVRNVAVTANYNTGSGSSVLTSNGIVPVPPTTGILPYGLVSYSAKSYGGGVSWTPVRRMVLTGTFSRSLSNTLSYNSLPSRNNTEIFYGQLQYRLRRIGLLAGYTRFTQGISATGAPPGTVTSYYGGISRWFNFF